MIRIKDYPGHVESVNKIISTFKKVIQNVKQQDSGSGKSEQNICELCQIWYFVTIDMVDFLPQGAKLFGRTLQTNNNSNPIKIITIAREMLTHVSLEILEDGADDREIMPYLLALLSLVLEKQFPNSEPLNIVLI